MKGIEESIEKMDLRKVSSEVREAIRKRGVAKIKSGERKGKVAEMFDIPNNTVTNWWKSYSAEGNKGLKDKKRGRKSEDCKLLSDFRRLRFRRCSLINILSNTSCRMRFGLAGRLPN